MDNICDNQPSCSFPVVGTNQSTNYYTKVNDRLDVFVKYFVEEFETKLNDSHMILEGKTMKAGRTLKIVGRGVGGITGGAAGSLLGSLEGGATLGAKAGERAVNEFGSEHHRQKAAPIVDLFELYQKDKSSFRRALISVGFDVFQSFEMQFMRLTTDLGPNIAMQLLARDATNRAMNYYRENKDACLTKGIILGESKVEPVCGVSIAYLKIKTPGFQIIYEYESVKNKWLTASLYEKVGLVIDEEASSEGVRYYEKKEGVSRIDKYGYRRLFSSEVWNELKNHYKTSNPIKNRLFTHYQYILDSKMKEIIMERIFKKIKFQDTQEILKSIEEKNSKTLKIVTQIDQKHTDKSQPKKTQTEGTISGLLVTKYYYIPRILGRNTLIKEDFKNETSKFFVTSSGHVDKLKLQISQDIVLISNTRTDFETLSNKYNDRNIHWLKEQDTDLIWQHSQGSLSGLRKYVDDAIVTSRKVEKISDIKDKLVIISAGPGMGKSTLLSHLAVEQQKSRMSDKVIRVNLNDHSDQLSKADLKNKNGIIKCLMEITEIKDLSDLESSYLLFDGFDEIGSDPHYRGKVIKLIIFLKDDVKQMWITTRPFAQYDLEDTLSVFSYTLEPLTEENQKEFLEKFWKTNFIYDVIKELTNNIGSADEDVISLSLADKVSQIIELEIVELKDDEDNLNQIKSLTSGLNPADIKESVKKITNLIDKQQGKQHAISETIKDIVEKVAISPNLVYFKDLIQKRAKSYTEELIEKFSKSVSDKEREFTGVPLQIRMLAEAFQQEFYEDFIKFYKLEPYQRRLDDKPKLPDRLNLLDLYERFIENKCKINFVEKGKTDLTNLMSRKHYNDSRITFIENHRLLALNLIFSEENWKNFFFDEEKNKIKKLNEDIGQGEENTGIAYQIFNGKPRFIHRTFAEYFAADFFVNNVLKTSEDNPKYEQVRNFIRENIFKEGNEVIRDFFDRMLAKDEDQNQIELHTAVLNNDKGKVIETLSDSQEAKHIINRLDKGNRTALHLAAAYGYIDIVKVLLEYDASICTKDNIFGWSPLSYADKGHHWGVAELLLEKEASWEDMFEAKRNVNTFNDLEKSLLHIAAGEGYTHFAEVLVDKLNADLYAECISDKIPLHFAAERGNLNIVKFFLNKDGDTRYIKDSLNRTPLHLAVDEGQLEVVRYLGEKAGLNKMELNKYILNTTASNSKYYNVVATLLKEDVDVNSEVGGRSPIQRSVATGNLELVKLLVENGADIMSAGKNLLTPLHIAAISGHCDVVKYLVQELKSIKADINPVDDDGFTPILLAVDKGNLEVVRYLGESSGLNKLELNEYILNMLTSNSKQCENVAILLKEDVDVNSKVGGRCPIRRSVETGSLELVKLLVENGADIISADEDGLTPLHRAAIRGYHKLVMYLVQELKSIKADINPANNNGDTLLHEASIDGYYDIVKYLVQELKSIKADINPANNNGDTPLHNVFKYGGYDLIKYLVQELKIIRADINPANNAGCTPLHIAVSRGHCDLVKYLVRELRNIKSDINPVDNNGFTPILLAVDKGQLEIVQYLGEMSGFNKIEINGYILNILTSNSKHYENVAILLKEGVDVNSKVGGRSPIHRAVITSSLELVKLLVENGADIISPDEDGLTPLHIAAIFDYYALVKYLVQELKSIKADINPANNNGDTPLHEASINGYERIVKYLVQELKSIKADINPANNNGDTPLHEASIYSYYDIVKYLVQELKCIKADINPANNDGYTPLHSAASRGHCDLVKLLVRELKSIKADIKPTDNNGSTPIHLAVDEGHLEVVQYLGEKSGFNKIELNEYILNTVTSNTKYYEDVVFLLKKYVDVNSKVGGRAPIHRAAKTGSLELVKLLVENGADIISTDKYGLTPLHIAAERGHLDIVKYLLQELESIGADINPVDNKGYTPLYNAAIGGHLIVVKYFIEQIGEKICYNNDKLGTTLLHEAAFYGHYDIVEHLVREKANINAIDECGRTVVFCASYRTDLRVFNFLLKRNAIIDSDNGVSELGLTVLHVAAMHGAFTTVKDLVEKYSKDVNAGNGLTPLHLAAFSGNSQVIKYLIDKGANVDAEAHFPDIIKVLKENLIGILPDDTIFNNNINKLIVLFDDDPNHFVGFTPSFIYQLLKYKDKETLALLEQGQGCLSRLGQNKSALIGRVLQTIKIEYLNIFKTSCK